MNKNAIKKYAVWARCELIDRVSKKAMRYGIAPDIHADPEADSVDGRLLSDTEKKQRAALIKRVAAYGYEQTMEEAAYTWFNRFAALRFMEVNGYLPSHVRVFTNDAGEFRPQILAEAIHLDLPGLDKEKVYALKEANDEEALFRYLIIVQCNALNEILPGIFQRLEDFTELLLPDNLLREGSVIERLVKQGDAGSIPEEDWRDQVQIIGWLYQYYNTEPKDKVFADLKKNIKVTKEKIPAATQLFTPDWIVRYMVENSLGRLWLEGHPNESLQGEWKYYLPEAEQEESVQKQLAEMRKGYANIKPEDIRCIDPCMGSGHILCYMFDVLVKIYEDYGYTAREAAASILQNNLYGLDIDDRAAQLAYFAVMMKARQYDRRFFSRGIQPNVMAIEESNGLKTWAETAGDSFVAGQLTFEDDFIRMADDLIEIFQDAKEYGSILMVQADRYDALVDFIEKARQEAGNLLFRAWIDEVERRILPLIQQAKWLAAKYDVIVTNPPYMGASNMSAKLSAFVKKNYPDSKGDLFACFIERGNDWTKINGYNSMVTMQSWMFLSSFENMRKKILGKMMISTLMHMENMVLGIAFGTVVTVFRNANLPDYKGTYNHIKLADIRDEKPFEFPVKGNRFAQVATQNFAKIPGSPVAYWASDMILATFEKGILVDNISDVKIGMGTGKNDIFVRKWWEINHSAIDFSLKNIAQLEDSHGKYFPYNKGGEYRLWYGNLQEVLWFDEAGRNAMNSMSGYRENGGHDFYFRDGITWTFISSSNFGVRYLPHGALFDVAGSTLFTDDKKIKFILGFLSSVVCRKILSLLNPTLNYQAGNIKSLPIIRDRIDIVDNHTDDCVKISQQDWDAFETSWDFARHPIVQKALSRPHGGGKDAISIEYMYRFVAQDFEERFTKLKANEEELNRIFIDIYGLTDELTPEVEDRDVTVSRIFDTREEIPASMKGSNYAITKADVMKSLISYAVGCMFGRYSLDTPGLAYAGGVWDDSKYTTFLPDEDAIIPICDDEYFDDDIVGRFVAFITAAFGEETLEENLQFIADALGGRGSSREIIRSYFLTGFYADHIKTYQKRPIYWLFDSGKKNGFKCLVYMHRYGADTLARIRMDYVHEQQSRYRTAIDSLEQARDNAATAGDRVKAGKKLASVEAKAKELHEYEEKIHHLADQMIAIDLDDGVKHNYAIFQDVLAKIK